MAAVNQSDTTGAQARMSIAFSDEGIDEFDLQRLRAASQKADPDSDEDEESENDVEEDDFSMLRMLYQLPMDNDELCKLS